MGKYATIAVTNHAVDRLRRRSGAEHLPDEEVRRMVVDALAGARHEPHHQVGQTRALVNILGVRLWAVVGADTTGFTGPAWAGGRAVITFLTPDQVDEGRQRALRGLSWGRKGDRGDQ